MKRIVIREFGAPSVMKIEDVEIGNPGPGEIKVRNYAIGVNYTDVYFRSGNDTYLADAKQKINTFTPGKEGAGIVLEVGEDVNNFKLGDRVVYTQSLGAYGEEHIVKESLTMHLPDGLSFELAASNTLRGLTSYFLCHYTYPIKKGDIAIVHACTGGVGSLLTQWIKNMGGIVIGTIHTEGKRELAHKIGADFVINTATEDIVAKVDEFTNGDKAHVVFDGVGKAVAKASLDSLRSFGYYVNFGMVTGPVVFNLWELANHGKNNGSRYATFGDLEHHVADYDRLQTMAEDWFNALLDGSIKIETPLQLPLAEAPKAQELLESNKHTGTVILIP